MKKIAIIYHSGYGHTAYFANQVAEGAASTKKVEVNIMTTEEAQKNIDELAQFDGQIWGSPTYMGNVSAQFKAFMDASSKAWMSQAWRGKWAAGFTVSGAPSGDKMTTLITLSVLAAQQGMYWMPLGVSNEVYGGVTPDQAKNRLGSSLGAMAQAANEAPEKSFVPGDLKTAFHLGQQFAETVASKG
ncbi:MAG: flavodoxin family protein [Proteobacteria bacterium]|jgi:multimeric flavodoxin WrbA|nr:flavodoxin family protein [Pseudomonadota bacterium]